MKLETDALSFVIEVRAYEYPTSPTGPDADWLAGGLRLVAGRAPRVTASLDISWRTEELHEFNTALQAWLRREVGVAHLTHLEEQVGLTIAGSNEAGEISGFVTDDLSVRVEFRQIPASREAIGRAAEALETLLRAFPVRSSLTAE